MNPIGKVEHMLNIDWDNQENTKGVALVDKTIPPGTDVYAIPDTHRVVSVDLLTSCAILIDRNGYTAQQINAIIDGRAMP